METRPTAHMRATLFYNNLRVHGNTGRLFFLKRFRVACEDVVAVRDTAQEEIKDILVDE